MKIINEAYRVLSDPDLRKEHDEWIATKKNKEKSSNRKKEKPKLKTAQSNKYTSYNFMNSTDDGLSVWRSKIKTPDDFMDDENLKSKKQVSNTQEYEDKEVVYEQPITTKAMLLTVLGGYVLFISMFNLIYG